MQEFANLAKVLKEARIKSGLSQSQVAELLGFASSQFVSNWERAGCAPPSNSFQKLITVLKINREELVKAMVEDAEVVIRSKVYVKTRKGKKVA